MRCPAPPARERNPELTLADEEQQQGEAITISKPSANMTRFHDVPPSVIFKDLFQRRAQGAGHPEASSMEGT
jgi:hypothetical protein